MTKTAKDVLSYAKEHGTQMVSLRFIDFIGRWRHFAVPLHELNEGIFDEEQRLKLPADLQEPEDTRSALDKLAEAQGQKKEPDIKPPGTLLNDTDIRW